MDVGDAHQHLLRAFPESALKYNNAPRNNLEHLHIREGTREAPRAQDGDPSFCARGRKAGLHSPPTQHMCKLQAVGIGPANFVQEKVINKTRKTRELAKLLPVTASPRHVAPITAKKAGAISRRHLERRKHPAVEDMHELASKPRRLTRCSSMPSPGRIAPLSANIAVQTTCAESRELRAPPALNPCGWQCGPVTTLHRQPTPCAARSRVRGRCSKA